MTRVALWSNFPNGYVESKIKPRLAERGIQVTIALDEHVKTMNLSGVDCILAMHDMAGHKGYNELARLAKAYKKKIFVLSRKASFWDRDLKYVRG